MKKITAIFLAILLFCVPVLVQAEESSELTKGYLGDVNLDGKANAADALVILTHLVCKHRLEKWALDAADTDKNGKIESDDALDILKSVVGKESDLYRGVVKTKVPVVTAYAYWRVVEDDILTAQQAWICETYEEYQAFMELGYVDEEQRKEKLIDNYDTPAFDPAFFETYGLILWYRPSGKTTGGLHWSDVCVKGDRVYLDVVPYSTDYLHPDNAIDTVYAFFYQKGEVAPKTLMMRKCGVGPIYRYYSLSQFDFDLIEQAQPDGLHVSINGVEIKPSF